MAEVPGGEGAPDADPSPRAVERLESYEPPWPMPKLFRMTAKGKFSSGIFKGATINTPSMLANEDYLDALQAKSIGGYKGLVDKSNANLAVLEKFVEATLDGVPLGRRQVDALALRRCASR